MFKTNRTSPKATSSTSGTGSALHTRLNQRPLEVQENAPSSHPPTRPTKGASAQPFQTYQQDVDVSSDAAPVVQDLFHSSKQHAEKGLLDVLMSMDAGSQGPCQLVKDILRQKR